MTEAASADLAQPPASAAGGDQLAAQGSFALLLSLVLISVVNYLFAVTMSWLLSVEQYGVLGVSQSLLVLGGTVTAAGFPWALARLLSAGSAGSTPAGGRATVRSAIIGNVILGFGLAALVLLGGAVGLWTPASDYSSILLVIALTIIVLAVNGVLAGTLQGLFRLRPLGVTRAAEVVVKAVAGVALVLAGLGAVGAVLGFLVGAIAATVLAAAFLRGVPIPDAGPSSERAMLAAAGSFFVAMSALAYLSQADILTLKAFSPSATSEFLAGQYQVAVTLARIPFFATMAVFGALFPFLVRTAHRPELANAYAVLALKYTLLFVAPISVAMAAAPDSFIRLFFSSRYDPAADALAAASIANLVLCGTYALAILLQARHVTRRPAAVLALAAILQTIVAAIVVPTSGMVGAAAALGIAAAAAAVLLLPPVLIRYDFRPALWTVVRYAVALGTMVGLLLVLLPRESSIQTLVVLAVAALVYLVALVLMSLVTSADVRTLGGAIQPRGQAFVKRTAGAFDVIQGRARR